MTRRSRVDPSPHDKWPIWRRVAVLIGLALAALPVLSWLLLLFGLPLTANWRWFTLLATAGRALWLVLPGLALLLTLEHHWLTKTLAVLGALLLIPILVLLGYFGRTCAIGEAIATHEADDSLPRIQVVNCWIHIFHWYRVQQDTPLPLIDRKVATYLIGQDDSCPPHDLRFRSVQDGRYLIMSGRRYPSADDPHPRYFDLVLFDIDPGHGIHHRLIPIDTELSPDGMRYLHCSRFERRHEDLHNFLRTITVQPAPTTSGVESPHSSRACSSRSTCAVASLRKGWGCPVARG